MPATPRKPVHPKVKAGGQVAVLAGLLVAVARLVGVDLGIDTATEVALFAASALPVVAGYVKRTS